MKNNLLNESFFSCCFTGYRPQKFPFELSKESPDYLKFENILTDTVFSLAKNGTKEFYSGMAMGFDIIAAETVILYKLSCDQSIKLICAVPFYNQEKNFPEQWKERYKHIISHADEIIYTSENYSQGCYMKRNEFMVDRSDVVVTWFNGNSGGTKNTIRYAEKSGKKIINLYKDALNDYSNFDFFELIDNIDDN